MAQRSDRLPRLHFVTDCATDGKAPVNERHSYGIGARVESNYNFEEESSFGEKIMREFPYAEIFLLYLAIRLPWPPLVCQTIREEMELYDC